MIADNPENAQKSFDELEKDADKAFVKEEMEIAESENASNNEENKKIEEEVSEPAYSEEVENLSQKANESIKEIINTPVHKVDPHIEKLYELTNQAKTFIARGLLAEARAAVIE